MLLATLSLSLGASGVAAGAVATAPPKATTGEVISVLPTSANVAGTVDPHGTATKWYFQFGLSTERETSARRRPWRRPRRTSADDDVTANSPASPLLRAITTDSWQRMPADELRRVRNLQYFGRSVGGDRSREPADSFFGDAERTRQPASALRRSGTSSTAQPPRTAQKSRFRRSLRTRTSRK